MSRLFKEQKSLKEYKTPKEVQDAWNIVAKYLNKLPELSFSISPWNEGSRNSIRERKYTIHAGGEDLTDLTIVANTKWKNEDKQ